MMRAKISDLQEILQIQGSQKHRQKVNSHQKACKREQMTFLIYDGLINYDIIA